MLFGYNFKLFLNLVLVTYLTKIYWWLLQTVSVFLLISSHTGHVHWYVDTITKTYDAYQECDNYMDVEQGDEGEIHLYHHNGSNQKVYSSLLVIYLILQTCRVFINSI